jgi:hypothetical protein
MPMTFTELDAIVAASPGSPVDADFFTELKANLQLVGTSYGTDSFAGSASSTLVTVADQGSTSYAVQITPIGAVSDLVRVGTVGYSILSATQFRVYNTGSGTTTFSYKVMK